MPQDEDGDWLNNLTWTGAWVGVDSNTADTIKEYPVTYGVVHRRTYKTSPSANDPVSGKCAYSPNTFTVTGKRTSAENSVVFEKTEYLLDNGDGLEAHVDPAYELCVQKRSGNTLVTAAGSNEFGHFISVGRFEARFSYPNNGLGGKDGMLMLARRYVEEGDCRSFMNCRDVMEALGNEEKHYMKAYTASSPWKDKICRCDFYEPSVEQKAMFKERKRRETKKRRKK